MEFKPYAFQQYCIEKVIEQEAIGLFLEMGLGKTAITLTALNELLYSRFEISKVLIIAPLMVARSTWNAEAARWDHLKHLKLVKVLGSQAQRIDALNTSADLYIINRENVAWLVAFYGSSFPFDCVVIDELSSFKDSSTNRFKSLKMVRPKVQRVIGLTGTPLPNGYNDLWAQVYLLDQGERLGKTVTFYRNQYLDYHPWKHSYSVKHGAEAVINSKIKDLCVSMKSADYLQLPEMIVQDFNVVLPSRTMNAYLSFEKKKVLELADKELSVVNAAALSTKLLQFAGGAVFDEDKNVQRVHDCKLDAFQELLEKLNGQPVLVFYAYTHERDRILQLLKKTFKSLSFRLFKTVQDQDDWNAGKIQVLLAHPASTAYGLNLQQGGHHVCWFSLTWSAEQYGQANKRLHRNGQTKPVIVHRLVTKGTRDEDVAEALSEKGNTEARLMESLKARIAKYRN